MATNIISAFTPEERKLYVVIDPAFNAEAKSRTLALAAAAMLQWVDHAKATFSVSTAERYLESLYWDPSNPERIVMGVVPDTLSSLLEFGQNPRDLNSIFLRKAKLSKKGTPYKIIPINDQKNIPYATVGLPLAVSQQDISYFINTMSPEIASHVILSKMGRFSRSNVKTTTYKPAGKFMIDKKSQKFRTVVSPSSPNTNKLSTPADMWKHPGIRAALIGDKVSGWMEENRSRFMSPIFKREPGHRT